MTNLRLATGGLIDRARSVSFSFNGKRYQGLEGDTLASALLANNVHLTGRSFKYHRPRGITSAGVEEAGSLVELSGADESGNQPISTLRIHEGMDAKSINAWPSVGFDIMSVNNLMSRFIPAGFYYKTFMWPNWHLFEPSIRKAAGLADAPKAYHEKTEYETRNAFCDVLVVGAGPAGLMAALSAAASGARVMLADESLTPGGALNDQDVTIDNAPVRAWVDATIARLDSMENVTRLCDTTVWGYRENNLVMATERSPKAAHVFQRSWRIRAARVVIATGAIERPLVFANNDLPGVMQAGAVRAYVNRYAVLPGRDAVLFTNNNSVYPAAAEMIRAGIRIAAIVDARAEVSEADRAHVPGVEVLAGHVVQKAHGGRRVKGVTVSAVSGGTKRRIACDVLGCSGGWSPTVHLFSQSRGTLRYDDDLAAFVPDSPAQPAVCAGSANGQMELEVVLSDGAVAGAEAAKAAGFEATVASSPVVAELPPFDITALWSVSPDKTATKSFIDLQNDVKLSDLHLAMREGYGAIEHAKRYTTTGMAIDQGKTANVNAIGAVSDMLGAPMQEVGTTTFRAPFKPVEFGALAHARKGDGIISFRHTAITPWHEAQGAVMQDSGGRWRRPGYYPKPGEDIQAATDREVLATRQGVAIFDGSPLGKFEIKGPDALKLLELVYTNVFSTLKTGMGRYGMMLADDGLILDDGVTFKLADNHYMMWTSTGHMDTVHRHLEHILQREHPDWKVWITPVATQWANTTIAGPDARKVIEAMGTDLDLSPEALPFMAIRDCTIAGMKARLCRVTYTGELSFEIYVRNRDGARMWEAAFAAGQPYDITPIGNEALDVLRLEKGFLSIGAEVDGPVDPFDLGMGWIMSKKKADYIGKRSAHLRRSAGGDRRELIGLVLKDPAKRPWDGAPITPMGRKESSVGFVSTCVFSPVRNELIALGLLENGKSRHGETVHIRWMDEVLEATVTAPVFYDPKGERMNG